MKWSLCSRRSDIITPLGTPLRRKRQLQMKLLLFGSLYLLSSAEDARKKPRRRCNKSRTYLIPLQQQKIQDGVRADTAPQLSFSWSTSELLRSRSEWHGWTLTLQFFFQRCNECSMEWLLSCHRNCISDCFWTQTKVQVSAHMNSTLLIFC